MYLIFFINAMTLAVSLALLLVGLMVSKKSSFQLEKMSPFECGFSQKMTHRSLLSIHFFLVCLIFVIFDIELVLLFPFTPVIQEFSNMEMVLFVSVLLVLTFGLLWEWSLGNLEWLG